MDRLLDDAKRMLLAWHGAKGPVATPMAFWWDGRHLWTSTSASAGKVRGLEADPGCAVYVEPGPEQGRTGIVMRGTARVYRADDPVALATHGAVLAAATAALAVKNVGNVAGYVRDAAKIPRRWRPDQRVLLRVDVEDRAPLGPPTPGPGIAPGLPADVPPEVRRAISGRRDVTVATSVDGAVGLVPAVWGAGFTIDLADGIRLPQGTTCSVIAHHDDGFRPTEVAGVAVRGDWSGSGIDATKVRWWRGFEHGVVDVSANAPAHRITIPD